PVNTLPASFSTNSDTPVVLSGISISDVDVGGSVISAVLTVTHGTLSMNNAVVGGLSASEISGNGTATIFLQSTLAKINSTLANSSGLTFTPNGGFVGGALLTVVTNDLGNTGGSPQVDAD